MVKFEDVKKAAAVDYCILRGLNYYDMKDDEDFMKEVERWWNSLRQNVIITPAEKDIPSQTI